MKCKRQHCQKESAPGQVYCSKQCAPYTNLSNVEVSKEEVQRRLEGFSFEEKMAESTFPAPGDPSLVFKEEESTEKVLNGDHSRMRRSELGDLRTPNSIERSLVNAGDDLPLSRSEPLASAKPIWTDSKIQALREKYEPNGTNESEKTIAGKKMKEERREIHPVALSAPLLNTVEVQSHSMSLIDDSTKLLKDFMHSLSKEKADAKNIHAACDCAKNIRELIKLKMQVSFAMKSQAQEEEDYNASH